MNKKFKQALLAKCKDMGLSEKAIDELVALGINGLDDSSSDEDIENKVDSLVPFAKAMQGEVTRKTQKKSKPVVTEDDDKDNDGGEEMPGWFKAYKAETDQKIADLSSANEALKAEKAKGERQATIKSKAKELGIPSFLMKRLNINDDEDVEKVLTEYKQELVTNSLLPKGSALEAVTQEKAMKDDAKSWASQLPNK